MEGEIMTRGRFARSSWRSISWRINHEVYTNSRLISGYFSRLEDT